MLKVINENAHRAGKMFDEAIKQGQHCTGYIQIKAFLNLTVLDHSGINLSTRSMSTFDPVHC